jgi:hypothetical protein
MVRTRDQALAQAEASVGTQYPSGYCLQRVRLWLDIERLAQDGWDHDGRNEAMDAYVGAMHKHPGDRRPPGGVPAFFSGGGSGHVCLTTGSGEGVISTDWPTSRMIGRTTIGAIERAWGRTYVGWTEDLNGVLIPAGQSEEEIMVVVDAYQMIQLAYVGECGRYPSDAEVYPRLRRVLEASDQTARLIQEVRDIDASPESRAAQA